MRRISEQLSQAAQKKRQKDKLSADLRTVRAALEQERKRRQDLRQKLQKEGRDVDRLAGISLAGIFYHILGRREERLDKERQEYLAAVLKLEQCEKALTALAAEEKKLLAALQPLRGIEQEYQQLIAEKEKMILASGNPQATSLFALTEEIAQLLSTRRELEEAVAAGRQILPGLRTAKESLNSASEWGTWDVLGGGWLATGIKHSKIDEARTVVNELQPQLDRFARELRDVRAQLPEVKIDIESFATFADYFFDGLLADWYVQSKIHESLEQVVAAERTVANTVCQLEKRLQQLVRELEIKQQERLQLVEK